MIIFVDTDTNLPSARLSYAQSDHAQFSGNETNGNDAEKGTRNGNGWWWTSTIPASTQQASPSDGSWSWHWLISLLNWCREHNISSFIKVFSPWFPFYAVCWTISVVLYLNSHWIIRKNFVKKRILRFVLPEPQPLQRTINDFERWVELNSFESKTFPSSKTVLSSLFSSIFWIVI